jgi:glycosyltransferase involved in cell wall biosynthesis
LETLNKAYNKKVRVGITAHVFICWTGGVDYLTSIVHCMLDKENIELSIIVPDKQDLLIKTFRFLKRVLSFNKLKYSESDNEIVNLSNFKKSIPSNIKIHHIASGIIPLLQISLKEKIDVLLPVMIPLPKFFPIKYVSYIPDFQYKHMPQNFTIFDIKKREKLNKKILKNSTTILLGAHEVENDIRHFFSEIEVSAFVLPLIASPKKEWLSIADENVTTKYKIKRNYFIVSNQFWKHKNHKLLFEAFYDFCKTNSDVDLVCTGQMSDYRNLNYINDLKLFIKKLDFGDRLHLLGVIPKLDQISLVKNSMALIQPTLFEGGPGGGSVYDGISLGKLCVVSNIPVNRELKEDNVVFFDPLNSEQLKNIMISISKSPIQNISYEVLIQQCNLRRKNAYEVISNSINQVLKN